MTVLFLVKRRAAYGEYGSAPFGLLYSARFVSRLLRHHNIWSEVIQVDDGNSIDKELVHYNPDTVILEALWATPAKVRELMSLKRHAHRQFVVRIHSKPSFLSMEGIAMKWLAEFAQLARENPRFKLAVNNKKAKLDLDGALNTDFLFLPNYYFSDPRARQTGYMRSRRFVSIGCFGAQRPLKNVLEQAIAAITYADATAKKLKFYINSTRVEQHGENVVKNVRELFKARPEHELIEVGWRHHDDFVKLVRTLDLGMQASFSESFNIVTADFVSAGVPIVVSHEIDWMPRLNQVATGFAMKTAIKLGDLYFLHRGLLAWWQRRALAKYNDKSERLWLKFARGSV